MIPTISPSTHTSPPSRNDFNIDVPQAMLIQGQKENERNLFSLNRAPDSNVWCIPGAIPTVTSSKRKRKRRSGSSLSENGGLSRRDQVSVNACVKRLVERVVVLDRMRKRKEMWALEKQRKEREKEKKRLQREREMQERRKKKLEEAKQRKEKKMLEDKIRAGKRRLKQKELMERKRMKSQIQPVMRSMVKHVVEGDKRNYTACYVLYGSSALCSSASAVVFRNIRFYTCVRALARVKCFVTFDFTLVFEREARSRNVRNIRFYTYKRFQRVIRTRFVTLVCIEIRVVSNVIRLI